MCKIASDRQRLQLRLVMATLAALAIGSAGASAVRAQAETLPRGQGSVSVIYFRSSTGSRFDFLGDRVRVIPPAGPEFRGSTLSSTLSADVTYGITNRFEAHVTVPLAYSRLKSIGSDGKLIDNSTQSPTDLGLSNIRFGGRFNIVREPLFITVKFDVKAPATSPDVTRTFNGTTLPIQEGQADFDLTGQISRSLTVLNHPLTLGGEAGHRFRRTIKDGALDTFTNKSVPVTPAGEFIYNFRVSYGVLRRLSITLAGDGIEEGSYSVPFRFIRLGENGDLKTVGTEGIPPGFKSDFGKQSGRRIFSLGPLANVVLTRRTSLVGGVLFTVAGRNYPAGQFLVLGLSRAF